MVSQWRAAEAAEILRDVSRRPAEVPGWDSDAEIVDELFIERVPRRPEVRAWLEQECRLLPAIAPRLPLPVPVPVQLPPDADHPWRVRHRRIPGTPAEPLALTEADGKSVGSFLRVLHDLPTERLGLGPDAELPSRLARMARDVLPLLDEPLRADGAALLERGATPTPLVLAHGDLGPDHLLVDHGSVTGIIDWSDACLRDPAIDLAWILNGTSEAFSDGVHSAYGPTPEEVARSRDWHRLGPWHEVLYGLDEDRSDWVASGLEGVIERLT